MPGDSKTEKATPKKRQDERKKGNVFLSKDVITVVSLIGVFGSFKFLFGGFYSNLKEYIIRYINIAGTVTDVSNTYVYETFSNFGIVFAQCALPILLIAVVLPIAATVAQTKPMFVFESLKPKFSKLNPINGIKNMFSLKSLIELVKGIIKITILLAIMYNFVSSRIITFARMISMDLVSASVVVLDLVFDLIVYVSIAFVAISAFDFLFQWWDYERQIKMSKQEIKEEYKQLEGDPQIKGKIKENQRRMAQSRMMQAVPSSDVVIKNPTHYAVALKYDIEKDEAPILVAKGQDELALRIIKVAEENGVAVIENPPIARAIYSTTDLKAEIPPEFYGTIAEILVYVYQLNNKKIL